MARIKEENASTAGQKLNIIRSVRKEVFESLNEEMLAEVEDVMAQKIAEKENRKKDEKDLIPKDYKIAIEECPAVLRQFFTALAMRTGWSFTVLMGGPDPQKDGNITSHSFHIRENNNGNNFNDAHPTFSETFMSPYTNFLETVYPKEIRQMRAQNREKTHNMDNESESTSGANESCDASKLPDASSDRNNDTSGLRNASDNDDEIMSEDHDVLNKSGHANLASSAKITCDTSNSRGKDSPTGNGISPDSGPPNMAHPPISASSWDHRTTISMQGDSATCEPGLLPGMSTTGSSEIANLPEELNWQSNSDVVECLTNGILYNYPQNLTNAPDSSVSTGTWEESMGFEGNWMFGDTSGWNTNKPHLKYPGMLYSPNYWPMCSTPRIGTAQNTSYQYQQQYASNLLLPPHSGHSSDLFPEEQNPIFGTTAAQNADNQGQYFLPLPHSPDEDLLSEVQLGSMVSSSETTGLLTSQHLNAEAAEQPEPRVPAEKSSRFGRTIIPSTRLEKMNEIGSSAKENVPPVTPRPSNEWVTSAKEHLLQLNLSGEWISCINAWLTLEGSLDYGAKTKGALPLAKQRPDEWTKWISKFRSGVRQYQLMPTIKDVELFGITCMKWWHNIQPSFQHNGDNLLPLPSLTSTEATGDPWANLRKGGPNRLVIVVLLLSWWGQYAIAGTDTAKQWCETIADVQCVFQTMTAVSSKRAVVDDVLVPSKKK